MPSTRTLRQLVTATSLAALATVPMLAAAAPAHAAPAPVTSKAPTMKGAQQFLVTPTHTSRAETRRSEQATAALARQHGRGIAHQRRLATGTTVVRLDKALDAGQAAAFTKELSQRPGVASVEVDQLMHTTVAPTDPMYAQQWHYSDPRTGINLPAAHDITRGKGATIGVIDSGITPHPDLAPVSGYDFVTDPAMSRDGNGRDANPNDEGDWSDGTDAMCPTDDGRLTPSAWHGSHVSGTINARTNNGVGVAGVAPDAQLFMARALGHCGGYTSDIIDAMLWSSGVPVAGAPTNPHPASVLNMSLGGQGSCSTAYQNAINTVVARGTTVVVAAGNENQNVANVSPASCSNTITVAATGPDGNRAYYSNYGSGVDIAAPGGNQQLGESSGILSTVNSGQTRQSTPGYGWMQGTSMAAPHVAGIVALMKSANPSMTPAQIEQALKSSARPFVGTCSGCGAGMVDAAAAVRAAAGTTTPTPTPAGTVANGDFEKGATGWTLSDPSIVVNSTEPNSQQHSGSWSAWLGGYGTTGSQQMSQQVAIPAGARTLSFWLRVQTEDDATFDADTLTVGLDQNVLKSWSNRTAAGTWSQQSIDVRAYAGRTMTLTFASDEDDQLQTSFFVDDVIVS